MMFGAIQGRLASFANREASVIAAYAVALAVFVFVSVARPAFAGPAHLSFLLLTASYIGIVALGQTFVIIGGGIDLSIPWTLNMAATLLTAIAAGRDMGLVVAIPVVYCLAAAIGLVNGVGIALLGIPPIVMTLAMNVAIEGGLLALLGGTPTSAPPHLIVFLATGSAGAIPMGVIIWASLALIATAALSLMTFGRFLYAIGTNRSVAAVSGVNVARVEIITYVISGLSAATAGILLTGFVGQSYLGLGDPYLFASVAAVAIGGASILGGSGHYLGSIAGALTLTVLAGLLPILNLDPGWLEVAYGIAILITVGLASLRRPLDRSTQ